MINHIRTLLFGRSGYDAAMPGHVLVDPSFIPGPVVGELALADEALFGVQADNFGRNFWLAESMRILHAPEQSYGLAEYDPRITYCPFVEELFDLYAGPNPASYGGTPVFFVGTHRDDIEGRLYRRWDAVALIEDQVSVSDGLQATITNLTWTQGLSNLVAMPGSPLQFRIGGGVLTAGTKFRVELFREPAYHLHDIPNRIIARLSSEDLFRIFDGSSDLLELWQTSNQLAPQLAAFLYAYARRLERRRGGVG